MSFQLGSISHGTLREADLIPKMLDEVRTRNPKGYKDFVEAWRDSFPMNGEEDIFDGVDWERYCDDHSDNASYMANESLPEYLQVLCPIGIHFGHLEGDGSDLGYWINDDELEEFIQSGDIYTVEDLSEIDGIVKEMSSAPDFTLPITVLHTNDHGNRTLYEYDGTFKELWSAV